MPDSRSVLRDSAKPNLVEVMSEFKMVVGLGNPGAEYADTRHNIGYKVIDLLAETLDIEVKKRKFGGRFGVGEFEDKKLILLKPWRFMNLSGGVVVAAANFYKVELCDLLVVVDDMALQLGRIRLRATGSAGGHKGLADIIAKLGNEEFARCRIGIGRSEMGEAVDYVLSEPGKDEKAILTDAVAGAKEAVSCWITRGIEVTMNEFNT